jgi:hypothetical protein
MNWRLLSGLIICLIFLLTSAFAATDCELALDALRAQITQIKNTYETHQAALNKLAAGRRPSSGTEPQFRPNERVGPDPIAKQFDWRQQSLGHDQGELRRMNIPCEIPSGLQTEMQNALNLTLTYPR